MTESSRIYGLLKQDIVTCALKPGLSISEQEMCLRYQVSRTPIREACSKLCGESLMQMIPFRGYSIPPLTFEEYRNLNELQGVVEPAVAALAAERATHEQIKEMESWAGYEYHVGQKNSYYKFLEWNYNFHICIAAASRNHAFLEVVRNVQTRLMRYYYLVIVMDSYGPALIEEHQLLVRAIKAGNPKLAAAKATEHLTNTSRRAAIIDLASANHCIDPMFGEEEMGQVHKSPARTVRAKKLLVGKRRRELLSR